MSSILTANIGVSGMQPESDLSNPYVPLGQHINDQHQLTLNTSNLGLHQPPTQPTNPRLIDNRALFDLENDFQLPVKPAHDYGMFRQQVGVPVLESYNTNNINSNNNMPTSYLDSMEFDPAFTFASNDDFSVNLVSNGMNFLPDRQHHNVPFPISMDLSSQYGNNSSSTRTTIISQPDPGASTSNFSLQQLNPPRLDPQARLSKRSISSTAPLDQRSEDIIARVINQIRQNGKSVPSDDSNIPPLPHHTHRLRKDEDDMDDDERLLASEEGKRLSSKERRQLRNKVSARAFRSRRKEYIGYLENEVMAKNDELSQAKRRMAQLQTDSARSHAFIGVLLRHPAFQPFLEELGNDPSLTEPEPFKGNSLPPLPSQLSTLQPSDPLPQPSEGSLFADEP